MKAISIILVGGVFALAQGGQAQGFVNLDFESADVSGYPPRSMDVPIASALPGWSGFYGNIPVGQVWYDGVSLGGTAISVVDNNVGVPSFGPIDGVYSAWLFGSYLAPATISQTGLVPTGTKSLQVDIQSEGTPFQVSLGGQSLSMVPLQTFPTFTLYGADISSFGGLTENLAFTSPVGSGFPGVPLNFLEVDDIVFSPNAIPEPASWVLLVCGAGVFALSRRKHER